MAQAAQGSAPTVTPAAEPALHLLLLNAAVLAVFWGLLFFQWEAEWSVNPQYQYGYLVPLGGAYLLMLRWADRPAPETFSCSRRRRAWLVVTLVALAFLPARVLFEANADWRLLAWAQALAALWASWELLGCWGGRTWQRHALPPLLFLLFAVPWPRKVETVLVDQLTGAVTQATVDTLNFLGMHAERLGNAVRHADGLVQVEEACSGMRSFQSTLMVAFFLGELLRLRTLSRALLIGLAAGAALFFNYGRTVVLTLVHMKEGPERMEQWHDPAGYTVYVLSFVFLCAVAWVLKRLQPDQGLRHGAASGAAPMHPLGIWAVGVPLALSVASLPGAHLWYALRKPEKRALQWEVQFECLTPPPQAREIPARIRDSLFFDRGELYTWSDPVRGCSTLSYYFIWNDARAAQLGGVHKPELCLPATGWKMTKDGGTHLWRSGPLEIVFNAYTFANAERSIHVFYGQWDPAGYPYHLKQGRYHSDRLWDAWVGDRKEGKRKLEIVIAGTPSLDAATAELDALLNRVIVVQP